MKYQTDYAKCDWSGLCGDVSDALKKLQVMWQASQKGLSEEAHKQLVETVYAPTLEHLAQFCIVVNDTISIDGVYHENAKPHELTVEITNQ